MQTFNQAMAAAEVYSPAEEQFNRRRRTVGLWLGPLMLLALWLAPLPLATPAHRMAAILGMVVVLWVSEALPMAATAILGPVLAVVCQVADARSALAPFADPIIFLFIGSFILAEAMFVHGVDRRIAYTALSWRFVGRSAARILLVYGGVGTAISMWISNTATTAMMFPIGLALVSHLMRLAPPDERARGRVRRFALGLMLMTSFGASVGGMATPVGTPPNLIGIGMLERISHVRISFFEWMAIGLPLVAGPVRLPGRVLLPDDRARPVGGRARRRGGEAGDGEAWAGLARRAQRPGRVWRRRSLLWILPGLLAIAGLDGTAFARGYEKAMPEGVAAMLGALLLFVLPIDWRSRRFTLTWDEAVRIDWGIVLLYGGGLAMGSLAFSTGLAEALGRGITAWLPSHTTTALTVIFTGAAILLVRGDVEHGVGEHDCARRDRRRAVGGGAADRAGAGRHAGREHGLHDADLDRAERHRLQLGLHPDHRDDALRHRPRPRGVRADRGGGDCSGPVLF